MFNDIYFCWNWVVGLDIQWTPGITHFSKVYRYSLVIFVYLKRTNCYLVLLSKKIENFHDHRLLCVEYKVSIIFLYYWVKSFYWVFIYSHCLENVISKFYSPRVRLAIPYSHMFSSSPFLIFGCLSSLGDVGPPISMKLVGYLLNLNICSFLLCSLQNEPDDWVSI